MAENSAMAAPSNGNGASNEPVNREKEMAEYEKEKQQVKDLLQRRNQLTRSIANMDAKIADLETKYLESTPTGNILTGFDNYTKGVTGAAAQRRKAGTTEQNRVFSRSSISYNPSNQQVGDTPASGASTPAAITPGSTSFANKEKNASGASDAPTPGSATDKKGGGTKKKKATADESETESREVKKIRTHFGVRGCGLELHGATVMEPSD